MSVVLNVKNLETSFYSNSGEIKAVRGVDFYLNEGEIFGIVGESGSGKSVAIKSILSLGPANCKIKKGEVIFEGENILNKTHKELMDIRGNKISIIFQDSQSALNPVYTIGDKLVEVIRRHSRLSKREAAAKAIDLLNSVGITDAVNRMKSYPHELSGGMRQRVMIATAISSNPKIIIADEPTTALDVTIQAQILHLLKSLQRNTKTSILLITHDLGVVAQMCSRVAIMCGGLIVEEGSVFDIFHNPLHPYTKALLDSIPKGDGNRLVQLPDNTGTVTDSSLCPFFNRCRCAIRECSVRLPEFYNSSVTHRARCFIKENDI